jgi:hypothetical protein
MFLLSQSWMYWRGTIRCRSRNKKVKSKISFFRLPSYLARAFLHTQKIYQSNRMTLYANICLSVSLSFLIFSRKQTLICALDSSYKYIHNLFLSLFLSVPSGVCVHSNHFRSRSDQDPSQETDHGPIQRKIVNQKSRLNKTFLLWTLKTNALMSIIYIRNTLLYIF